MPPRIHLALSRKLRGNCVAIYTTAAAKTELGALVPPRIGPASLPRGALWISNWHRTATAGRLSVQSGRFKSPFGADKTAHGNGPLSYRSSPSAIEAELISI